MPALKPTDRSISPSSRTKTSAMPSRTNGAPCTSRLTRLPAERKSEFRTWKKMTIAIRPRTTGSAPLSPLLTRLSQMRAYSPTESAISSGAPAIAALSIAASPASGSSATITGASPSAGSCGPPCCVDDMVSALRAAATTARRRGLAPVAVRTVHPGGGARGHQFHDGLGIEVRRGTRRGEPAEVEHRDAVGDLEHLGEVVRDDDDGVPPAGEPADEVEDELGLGDAERRGGLVHDDQPGVQDDRLGHPH